MLSVESGRVLPSHAHPLSQRICSILGWEKFFINTCLVVERQRRITGESKTEMCFPKSEKRKGVVLVSPASPAPL